MIDLLWLVELLFEDLVFVLMLGNERFLVEYYRINVKVIVYVNVEKNKLFVSNEK